MFAPARDQPLIHPSLVQLGDVVPTDALPVSGLNDRGHTVPRHALRGDLTPRQPLRAKLEHQPRSDLAYHPKSLLLPCELTTRQKEPRSGAQPQ